MRTAALGATLALLALAAPSSAQQAAPADRARMYPRPAREVWQAALDTLGGLGLKPDDLDREHQVVVTKFKGYGAKTVEGPAIRGYRAERFQLHVFVSPYAEPGRVHVGSLSELVKMSGGTSTMYNGGAAEAWFLDALDRTLGVPGRPIPVDAQARRRQAAGLGALPCAPGAGGAKGMEPPEKIKASDVKILFPAGASANAHKGVVVLAFEIGEDGAIYGTTVAEDTAPDQQFRHSALGVASLLRWIPARMDGCPVNTRFTYTIDYALERRGRR